MSRDYKFLVGEQWRASKEVIEIRSPYNGEVVGVTYQAGPEDVEMAIRSACSGFEESRRLPTCRRAEILERIAQAIKASQEELARLIALEAGKPIKTARGEVSRAVATFTDGLEESKRIRGEWLPLDLDAASAGRFALVRRFPVGPVAAITPFNFPLNLVAHKLAPALACGTSVVLKPAPQAPLSALNLARIIQEAGAMHGGVNVVPCSVEAAQPLVSDDRLKILSFTGSAAVGWALKQKAGKKRVVLELGGNAGVAIHSDADLDYAAERCVAGGFSYAGQSCIAVQRIYVHRPAFEEFTGKLLQRAKHLQLGDPLDEATDIGPMISPQAAQRAEGWIQDAVRGGAKLLLGGQRDGSFLEPAVLTNTKPEMSVCRQEAFAPLVTLEPYDDLPAALLAINNSTYGLQAGIFTNDLQAVFHAFETLDVGGVIVNEVPTYRADPMPYGGRKDSGLGREGVRYAIEEFTERKVLVVNLHHS
ncbi:MAG: aldehyde dehydrogenase family protein [Acidobacteria bacterium]|nr:aldehyde dehydrogenase family protein [Acidobacteriota bacterium]